MFHFWRRHKIKVILDVLLENGLFYFVIKNLDDAPVYKVTFKFDREITGLEGGKTINELQLFKNIEFLAPKKEIKLFVDTAPSFFQNNPEGIFTVIISYQNWAGRKRLAIIKHDLNIYRDIVFISQK